MGDESKSTTDHKCDGAHVCGVCGTKKFDEPNAVSGVLVVIKKHFHRDRILLCLRANNPGKGDWTVPGGHGQLKEFPRDTARRELEEETGLDAKIDGLKVLEYTANIYINPDRSVYVSKDGGERPARPEKTETTNIYRLVLRGRHAKAALDSLKDFDEDETKKMQLFTLKEISQLNVAFPFVRAAVEAYKKTKHHKNSAAIEIATDDWWQGSENEPAGSRKKSPGKVSTMFKKSTSKVRNRVSHKRQPPAPRPS